MIDVELKGYGNDGLLVHYGQFSTMEKAVSATEAMPYWEGHHQKIRDDETGVWQVRSNGSADWTQFDSALPRIVGWGKSPAASAMLLTD